MTNKQYPILLSPLTVGPVQLKNRAVFSAHLTNMAVNHLMSKKQAHYYEERAKGGTALIITEEVSVHPTDWAYEKLIDAFEEKVVEGYRYATDRVHRQGAKIFLQLNHNGSQGDSTYSRRPLWSASNVTDPLFGETCKSIDQEEIAELIEYYRISAVYAKEGHFDGIEFQASHSSILRQFLSPYSNKRTDRYGGSLENRFRLIKEIALAVRSVIGPEMALGIRLSGEEFIEGGLTLEDTVQIAQMAEKTGLFDYINLSIGMATHYLYLVEGPMSLPPAYAAYMAGAVKKAVKLPVITAGRIKDPKQAEKVLEQGLADLVGMVRAQISDPYFMKKTMDGEEEQINGCLSCNIDCIGRVGLNKEIGCVQNPYIGREGEMTPYNLPKATAKKKVVVVGGGPAGMEAAIIAAKRGHQVVLFEKSDRLGGHILLAAALPYRAELGDSIRNLTNELALLPVDIRLNTCATENGILSLEPQTVIIACGAKSSEHYLKNGQEHVYDLVDWLETRPELGEKVAIVDLLGSYQAASTAELLKDMGKDVEIFSGALQAGHGLGRTTELDLWTKRMKEKGVKLTPNTSVISVSGHDVQIMDNYSGAVASRYGIDNVLIAAPACADSQLYYNLKSQVQTLMIGDAVSPRLLGNAIYDGFNAAISI